MKVLQFAREVRGEVARVTWAGWSQTRGMTIAVFAFVSLIMLYLVLADWALGSAIRWLLNS